MQGEFEKKIRERMHTFGIQPAHQVWDEVDAALNRQKHRRFFVGWWILLGLAVLGGIIVLLDKNSFNKDTLNQQPIITSDTTSNNKFAEKPITPGTENKTPIQNNNNSSKEAQNKPTPHGNNNGIIDDNTNKSSFSNPKPPAALKNKGSLLFNSNTSQISNSATSTAGNTGGAATATQQNVSKNSSGDVAQNKGGDNNIAKEQQAVLNKDADSAITPPKQPQDTAFALAKPDKADTKNTSSQTNNKTIAPQKGRWFLTFAAGTTQTISQGAFTKATTNAAGPTTYAASLPAITALNAYKYNLVQPGLGFNISAGGLYERQLSPHWDVFGGVTIAYLSNSQQTGTLYKGNTTSNNTSLNLSQPQAGLNSYYLSGSSGTVVNKAWQANVPIGVGYVFNPKAKTKFILNGGFSFTWLYNSAWLIPDASYNELYYSKTLFNNTAVNWQIGPAIELKNQWRFGLQYQQSFTTLAKSYITPKLYWQNINIYTAIPLGIRKKHK